MDNDKNIELANLVFPNINEEVKDLEIKYPKRDLKEGAWVTRYAPSPTGFLHTGAMNTALVNKKFAKQTGGVFFLRVEDTDKKREVEGSIDSIISLMEIFGLSPDEGVVLGGKEIGNYGPYMQSKREEIYKICAKDLIKRGLAYPCFCTPEMLKITHESQEKNKVVPGYYGVYAKCRNISTEESIKRIEDGEPYIIRFRSSGSHVNKISYVDGAKGKIEIAENDQDVVIIKGDGLPTYHFAHIVDDHFMRTTHVIRGEEWIASVPLHIELFKAMEFDVPVYTHLPSIMIQDGTSKRKLSKRKDTVAAVSYFISAGYEVDSIIEYLLNLINSDYEPWRSKNKEADKLDFEIKLKKIGSAGALFDIAKLNDISKDVISRMDSKQLLKNVLVWAKEYDLELAKLLENDLEYSREIFALERDNVSKIRKDIVKYSDIKKEFEYFFKEVFDKSIAQNGYIFLEEEKACSSKIEQKLITSILEEYASVYDEKFTKEEWFNNIKTLANKYGFCTDMKEYKANKEAYIGSTSDFAYIIRVAITNRENTPDIYQIMQILGKNEVIRRLENVINNI